VYRGKKDPRENLRKCGATEEECAFLVQGREGNRWVGQRVEMNAILPVSRFVKVLERKLMEEGVAKLVPDGEALQDAFRHAWWMAQIQETIDRAVKESKGTEPPPVPEDLKSRIEEAIKGTPKPWNQALWEIVRPDDQDTGN
jgi:hypothetical protein